MNNADIMRIDTVSFDESTDELVIIDQTKLPNETVLLSTHLIEEVSEFIGRAVLIRRGEIVGDITTLELEEQGKDLMGYIKETYSYRADRVSKALDELSGKEE